MKQIVKRGCEYTKDDVQGMYAFAIEYDRKFGSLEDLETTERKYKEKIAKEAEILAESDPTIPSINVKSKPREERKPKEKQAKEKGNKRPLKTETVIPQELKPMIKKTKPNRLDTGADNNALSAAKNKQMEEEKDEKHESVDPTAYPDYLDNRNTVFVKNFPKSFEAEDLKAVFGNVDKITGCRIVKDKFENSKGLAYVDFINPEEAQFACQSNGLDIDGQKLFVALSDPPKKG